LIDLSPGIFEKGKICALSSLIRHDILPNSRVVSGSIAWDLPTMPVSILTSLLLWSALLLPGVKADPSQVIPLSQVSCQPEPGDFLLLERPTILSRSMDREDEWAIAEADTEEEESNDGDPEGIVSESHWIWLSHGHSGQLFSIRLDPGIVRSSVRSPILRC
jgi:hypothetical protein